jgi:hypothetical protein
MQIRYTTKAEGTVS